MDGVVEAQALAQQLLADELPRRFSHVRGVAKQAERLGSVTAVERRALLVAAAWLHDIGYVSELVDTGFHPIDGARYLRGVQADERVVNLVAHHSCASVEAGLRGLEDVLQEEFPRDQTLPHDELCYCDQTTSPDGTVMDVTERLAEIRTAVSGGACGPAVRGRCGVAADRDRAADRVESAQVGLGTLVQVVLDALAHAGVHLHA